MNGLESESSAANMQLDLKKTGDEFLILAAQSGDSSAFVELSNRYYARTIRNIYRLTHNWHDAEDVLQESLIKAFKHLHNFEVKACFSTWFMRIAINSALMLIRKKRSAPEIAFKNSNDTIQWDVLEPIDDRENPEQYCARKQSEHMLKRAILRLHPKYRKVVELNRTLSVKEIARSLGISETAVKTRLFRARIMLRAYLQGDNHSSVNADQVLGP